jgi:flavin-dependent dehydrogenase
MEREVVCQNPLLKKIFLNSEFLFDKPETINEISFETKVPIENHVLMVGDAAGMITPLCGNGMAMALHSSKILSDHIVDHMKHNKSRTTLEQNYTSEWNAHFRKRLWFGRQVQKLFGTHSASNFAVNLAVRVPFIANTIIKGTHGQPFG